MTTHRRRMPLTSTSSILETPHLHASPVLPKPRPMLLPMLRSRSLRQPLPGVGKIETKVRLPLPLQFKLGASTRQERKREPSGPIAPATAAPTTAPSTWAPIRDGLFDKQITDPETVATETVRVIQQMQYPDDYEKEEWRGHSKGDKLFFKSARSLLRTDCSLNHRGALCKRGLKDEHDCP